jgi:uncharacterized protein YpmS
MLTSIYDKIQDSYNNNFLNLATYKTIKANLVKYTNEITSSQTSLMEFLNKYIHCDLNFDIYVKDVRVLLDVNYKHLNQENQIIIKFIIQLMELLIHI